VLEEPVDVDRLRASEGQALADAPRVLWTGRPNNLTGLVKLDAPLRRAYDACPFLLRVVGGTRKPKLSLSVPWEWLPYDPARESAAAAGAVAALAPLEDTPFNRCKGNYKVKTCMALGIPVLTNAVGYNTDLIQHGKTGFFVDAPETWTETLLLLLRDRSTAERVGAKARKSIVERFSHAVLMPIWAARLGEAFPGLRYD